MNIDEVRAILADIKYADYEFTAGERGGAIFIQARYVESDIVTNDPTDQHTRKWYISSHSVPSEIPQTALLLVLTSQEHRVREHFLYKGERVYGPHFDIEALVEIARAKRLDYRGKAKVSAT